MKRRNSSARAPCVQFRLLGKTKLKRQLARPVAGGSSEHQKPPGRELAVIRHPRGDRQDRGEFLGARSRAVISGGGTERRRLRISIVSFIGVSSEEGRSLAEKRVRVNRLRSASICGHEPLGRRSVWRILQREAALTATWRILAALVALTALLVSASPAPAQAPAGDSAQATLSLSAVLNGSGAPLNGGLRWRVFGSQADPDGSHPLDRRIRPGPTDPHHTAGRLRRSCRVRARQRGQTRDAWRGCPLRTVGTCRPARFASRARSPTRRSTRRSCRSRSTCRKTAIRSASSSMPKRRRAISSDCRKAPITSCRPTWTRSAPIRA